MRKILFSTLLSLLLPMTANAYDAEINGIYYNFSGYEATVTYKNTSYNSYSGQVVIPSSVTSNDKKYSVTTIGSSAFYGCSGLTSVTIPSSVTVIDNNAFYNCSELTTVTFPGGSHLKSVGTKAFNNCKKMTSFNLGDKLTSMGELAFYECRSLESITIPGTLKIIPRDAFEKCYALASVTLCEGIEEIVVGAFYDTDSLKEITIPASVKKVGRASFHCRGNQAMKRMILSDSDIPLEFANGTDLTSSGSEYLTDDITLDYLYLGRDINRVKTGNPLIYNTKKLEIGSKVTTISDNTFKNCSELTIVTFPGGSYLKRIGTTAFDGCKKMTSFNLGDNLTSMGDYAFRDCQSLDSITIPGTLKIVSHAAFERCYALASVTLCDGIEEIGNGAFYNTVSLASITITASVKKVGRALFYCAKTQAMKRMIIADSDTPLEFDNGDEYNYGYEYLTDDITLDYFYLGRDINRVKTGYSLVYKTKELEIGPKVTTISDDPNGLFYRTEDITSVKSRNLNPFHINDYDFYKDRGIYDNATLWIPYGTRQAYIDANWKFKNIQYLSFLVVGTATNGGTLKFAGESVTNGTKSVLVDRETDVTFEVIPASNYDFTSLTVDGEPVNVENGCYIYPNLLSNIDVVATFTEKPKFNITAKATGGTVSLNGKTPSASQSIKVYRDTDVTLTVAAAEGYEKPKVTVNGTDVSAQLQNNKLILQNIQEAKTIVVTFAKKKFQIKKEAVQNGTIELSKTVVEWGDSFTATFKPATGYEFATATVNGKDVTANVVNNVLTVTNVKENKTVGGSFKKQTFSVTVSGDGVSVSNTRPEYGDNVTVTIADDPDRTLVSLLVNGEDVTAQVVNGQYVITNVDGNVTVEATFKSSKEFITMTSEYAMFSCDQDLDFTDSDLCAYIASGFNKATNQVLLVRVCDVPARTGIYLKGIPGTTYKVPYRETSSYYVNLFKANLEKSTIDATAGECTNYIFNGQDGEPGFDPIVNNLTLEAKTAYLQLPSSFVTAGVKVSVVFEEDIIDGIEDFRISDMDAAIYDLAGRRLGKTQRGINIVNGKKVLR